MTARRLREMLLAAAILAQPAPAGAEAPHALTLDDAIQLALETTPDRDTAQHRVAAAQAAAQQAAAAFWPQVRLSESYAGSDNPVQAFMMTLNQRALSLTSANFNDPDVTDNLNTKVLATYNLYNGGRDLAQRQAARLDTEGREAQTAAVRNDLIFEVTRAFYTIAKARQFVNTATAAVQGMEANRNVASNRVASGQALKTDQLDAEVRLAEARENLVRARTGLAIAETIFRNVIGVGESENVTAADTPHPNPLPQGEREPKVDISERPERIAAQKAVEIAAKRLRAATGGYHPRVNAFASYDLDSGNAHQFEDSWVAGVSVDLDVFDGFLTRGKVAEARAELAAAREQLRRTELALQWDARQAQLNVEEAAARLSTTERTAAQAEESLQVTRERYGNGLALLSQVLDAETALTSARQRRAAAESDYHIAEAALAKALGTMGEEIP